MQAVCLSSGTVTVRIYLYTSDHACTQLQTKRTSTTALHYVYTAGYGYHVQVPIYNI